MINLVELFKFDKSSIWMQTSFKTSEIVWQRHEDQNGIEYIDFEYFFCIKICELLKAWRCAGRLPPTIDVTEIEMSFRSSITDFIFSM